MNISCTTVIPIALLGCLLVSGCSSNAGLPDAHRQYLSDDVKLRASDEFRARAAACKRKGGFVVLPVNAAGRADRGSMERASCARNRQPMGDIFR